MCVSKEAKARRRKIVRALHRGVSTAECLAERFSVTTRTIYRDVDALCAQGYRILGETGVGYMLRPEVRT